MCYSILITNHLLIGFIVIFCFAVKRTESNVINKTALYIGAFFPMSDTGGWPGGQACRPSAMMALEDVNKRGDLLPGYELKMMDVDSQCQPGLGAKMLYDLLYRPPVKIILLTGCSLVTTVVAEAAHLWNLLVLSYGASSPALSDRTRFPSLFRTHPNAIFHNPARVAIFNQFGWKKIAILQSVEEVFTSTADHLEQLSTQHGIKVLSRQSFFGDPSAAVKTLRRQDARIIVGVFYEKEAKRVFCEVYKAKLYGKKYVWFLIGWYGDDWYNPELDTSVDDSHNCTLEQMIDATQYHITTEAVMLYPRDEPGGLSNMSSKKFQDRLNARLPMPRAGGYVESPLAYDAVLAVAKALNCTQQELIPSGIKLEDFNYQRIDVYKIIHACMDKTIFEGVSGTVMFADGDRIAQVQIEQMRSGKYIKIGTFDSKTAVLNLTDEIRFLGNVPHDGAIISDELMIVSRSLFIGLSFIACISILFAFSFLGFNLAFSYRRYVEQSQPYCNNLMLFGCVICCATIIPFGMDGAYVKSDHYSALCQTRVYLLIYGFSLAYGPLFSKVWRAHRMSAKEARDKAKHLQAQIRRIMGDKMPVFQRQDSFVVKPVVQWKLYTVVIIFLVLDTLLIVAWSAVDPLQRKVIEFHNIEDSGEEDLIIRPLLEQCNCKNQYIWIGVVFSYKGVLLLFGLFLAYDIRNVKLKYINDCKFVGMSIYNVVVLCLITGPVSLIILNQPDASFGFVSASILLCCLISIGLIFAPKVLYILRTPNSAESRALSEAQVTKEEEERYRRLLAENEDIKRQIAEKEVRIRDLKRRLEERLANQIDSSAENNNEPSVSQEPIDAALAENDCPIDAPLVSVLHKAPRLNKHGVKFNDGPGVDAEEKVDERVEVHSCQINVDRVANGNNTSSSRGDAEDSGYRGSGRSDEPQESDIIL